VLRFYSSSQGGEYFLKNISRFFFLAISFYFSLEPLAHSASVAALLEQPLLKFRLSEEAPRVGEPSTTLFVQAELSLPRDEILIEATLDGSPFALTQSAPSLWLGAFAVFSEVKTHQMEFRVLMRPKIEAARIQDALARNELSLLEIARKIETETNPQKLSELLALRAEKTAYKNRLSAELAALAIYLKSEFFSFQVSADPSNANFPFITRLNPGVGLQTGGSEVRIQGRNFLASPEVRIGGVLATVVEASEETIKVIAPALGGVGVHDVEVKYPLLTKNAVLRGGYFASAPILLKNIKPVAVVSPYRKVSWPNPPQVQLDASGSYDENGDAFAFEWKVVASPAGSSLAPGSVLSTAKKPKFTPDAAGFFVFQLLTKETATSDQFESAPTSTTVEVNP